MDAWVIVFLTTIAYLLVTLAIGLVSGRNVSNTPEGYVAGDRSLGFLLLYFIMGASIYSAFAFLGAPGLGLPPAARRRSTSSPTGRWGSCPGTSSGPGSRCWAAGSGS